MCLNNFLKYYASLGACGNGHVIFAHIIERRIEWRDYETTVTGLFDFYYTK